MENIEKITEFHDNRLQINKLTLTAVKGNPKCVMYTTDAVKKTDKTKKNENKLFRDEIKADDVCFVI